MKKIAQANKDDVIKDLKKLQRKYSSLINLDVEELDNIIELKSETLKEQYSSKRKLKLKNERKKRRLAYRHALPWNEEGCEIWTLRKTLLI